MPYVDLPEGRGFYVTAGVDEGRPPAVLIHGAGGSHLDWPAPLRRLRGRRTYVVDLPAHGRSTGPRLRSISAYRQWMQVMATRLDLPPAVWIGHSMGAAIALDLAVHAPSCVAALVLIGAGARLPVAPAFLRALVERPGEALMTLTAGLYAGDTPESVKRLGNERLALVSSDVLRDDFMACNAFDVRNRLHEVSAPSLVLCGDSDRMTPPAYAQELHAQLPASSLTVIEVAGHMVTFERTDAVMAAIDRFLDLLPG
jgi:pimeloyl-ACP methyl ester carboxylesterase